MSPAACEPGSFWAGKRKYQTALAERSQTQGWEKLIDEGGLLHGDYVFYYRNILPDLHRSEPHRSFPFWGDDWAEKAFPG